MHAHSAETAFATELQEPQKNTSFPEDPVFIFRRSSLVLSHINDIVIIRLHTMTRRTLNAILIILSVACMKR
jgi:hypothetical protein